MGRKLVRRLMRETGIWVVYPKPNLSKRNFQEAIVPYLLRNKVVSFPNQVWSIDIIYIKLNRGHMYLTAIIDWCSRKIVGWNLSDTLGLQPVLEAVRSDEWTVRHVSENPYLQYFLGLKEYTSKCPFGASTMVEFRKRFPPEAIAALLATSTPKENQDDHDDRNGGGSGENRGALIMDATCCPADISHPHDFQLLNEAREKLEHIVDVYCESYKLKKPRMRRRTARRDYLKLSKCVSAKINLSQFR